MRDHRKPRCLRTIREAAQMLGNFIEPDFVGTKHHALDDARHQARVVIAAYAALATPHEAPSR